MERQFSIKCTASIRKFRQNDSHWTLVRMERESLEVSQLGDSGEFHIRECGCGLNISRYGKGI
ncbi:MAG: hypothetical protein JXR78_11900 [Victivallales bacterium]|nr:hypothetical protein [Victivallales bacterium]